MSSEPIEAVVVRDNSTVVALERVQIDTQIATAKAYPRSVEVFKQDCLAFATLDQETAESMTYAIPRDGKMIEGPSVRLAEIAGSCWGHTRYGSRVVEVSEEYLVARGMCWDLQRNVAIEIDVRRRIVNKSGKRYSQDMINTTGQAACAIALRNAIFKVVPMALIKPAMEQAKKVAAGDAKSLSVRRDAALLWFKEKGIKPEQVFGLIGVKGKDDVTLANIVQFQAIRTAVKDGEATLDDFFKTTHVDAPDLTAQAFTQPESVTGEDDPQKRGSEPLVEATLIEGPKSTAQVVNIGEAIKAEKGKKKPAVIAGPQGPVQPTSKTVDPDDAIDKLFS
jgi:hypothetical protein